MRLKLYLRQFQLILISQNYALNGWLGRSWNLFRSEVSRFQLVRPVSKYPVGQVDGVVPIFFGLTSCMLGLS